MMVVVGLVKIDVDSMEILLVVINDVFVFVVLSMLSSSISAISLVILSAVVLWRRVNRIDCINSISINSITISRQVA